MPVHYYLNAVKNRDLDLIILAVQDPTFKYQIIKALTEANCRSRVVFTV